VGLLDYATVALGAQAIGQRLAQLAFARLPLRCRRCREER
jgi:hypothetical protein